MKTRIETDPPCNDWTAWASEQGEPVLLDSFAGSNALRGRILVVDDLDLNRRLLRDMLAIEGYEVDCAVDGISALQAVEVTRYDLILMDLVMPGLDGIATTKMIRERTDEAAITPIIALTANCIPEQRDICRRAGMDDLLVKPVSLEDLAKTVDIWMDARRPAR